MPPLLRLASLWDRNFIIRQLLLTILFKRVRSSRRAFGRESNTLRKPLLLDPGRWWAAPPDWPRVLSWSSLPFCRIPASSVTYCPVTSPLSSSGSRPGHSSIASLTTAPTRHAYQVKRQWKSSLDEYRPMPLAGYSLKIWAQKRKN